MPDTLDQMLVKFDLDRAAARAAGQQAAPVLDQLLDQFGDGGAQDDGLPPALRDAQKRHWQLVVTGDLDAAYGASAAQLGRHYFHNALALPVVLAGYTRAIAKLQSLLVDRAKGMRAFGQGRSQHQGLAVLTRLFGLDLQLVTEGFFAAQTAEQALAFDHLRDGMSRMAAGNLVQQIPGPQTSDYPARYEDIRLSFNGLMDTFCRMLTQIQSTSLSIDHHAREMTAAASDLSRRTETQAATLEQTAAAVEQITSTVRSSAAATVETDQVVAQAQQNARRGNDVVQESVAMMRDIATASAKITAIVAVIDDMAFQTNLLALNAGVEAARAGEAGRGFAVVASEVRNLAQRASGSAGEIKALIQHSTDLVTSGVQLADQAGDALTSIVTEVARASVLMSEVAQSSQGQSTALSEISTGVAQLDRVTQHNAAMAEQTAAAVSSMQTATRELAGLVNGFVLHRHGQTPQARVA